ncbi:hypothetical protein BV25DRAFT_1528908 [Artomyces pyxidatus]|uniref:Uncharacterized protein n=1 Tax=Artomyces pyxidatus TaxID=48021 RepID=A0ACB8TC35_9AGAM|nr:hypothetical protein BV25DRAFT_1528908 [Artomyces pyxidatus]
MDILRTLKTSILSRSSIHDISILVEPPETDRNGGLVYSSRRTREERKSQKPPATDPDSIRRVQINADAVKRYEARIREEDGLDRRDPAEVLPAPEDGRRVYFQTMSRRRSLDGAQPPRSPVAGPSAVTDMSPSTCVYLRDCPSYTLIVICRPDSPASITTSVYSHAKSVLSQSSYKSRMNVLVRL